MMNDLDKFAKATPFNAAGVISQSQKMIAMGWNADNIIRDMKTIGDAAAATGKGDEGLNRISLALSQIASKGKLSSEELNQLAESGISARRYIAEGMGFGSDDKGLQQMTKILESGKIGSNEAIGYLLKGMQEYEGMMDKTAKETVSGIKSNLQDTFEINIARRWGQGLQDGMKTGLGSVAEFLDENEGRLEKLGDQLQRIGSEISNGAADVLKGTIDRTMGAMNSSEFKSADLFGKVGIVWDEAVGKPFDGWWNGAGGASLKAKASEMGKKIGKSIAEGVMESFKMMLGSAAKLIPGGEGADAVSWLSGGLLAKGAMSLGGGKLLSGLKGKISAMMTDTVVQVVRDLSPEEMKSMGGILDANGRYRDAHGKFMPQTMTQSMVQPGIGGMAMMGIGGAVVGGIGLVSAVNDMVEASRTINEKTKQDYMFQGATKAGMVAAGTALGAAVGSVIPGLGTLVGAGIGAGVGGLGALTAGGGVGKYWSDQADGTARLNQLSEEARVAKQKVEVTYEKKNNFDELVEEYKQVQVVVELIEGGNNEQIKSALTDELTEIQTQAESLEAKITNKDGTKAEIAQMKQDLEGLKIQEITINTILTGELSAEGATTLQGRLDELKKLEIEVEAKLKNTNALSDDEYAKLTGLKTSVEAEAIAINAALNQTDMTTIDSELKKLHDQKAILLNLQKGEDGLDAETKKILDKALSDVNIAEMTLQLKATGLSDQEAQDYIGRFDKIKQALVDASDGLLSQYDLEHQKLDQTIEKLNTIKQIKEQEAKIADTELMQQVYEARGSYGDYSEKIQKDEQDAQKYTEKADEAKQASVEIRELGDEIQGTIRQNELDRKDPSKVGPMEDTDVFGLTSSQNEMYQKKLQEMQQKFPEYFQGQTWQLLDKVAGADNGRNPLADDALSKSREYGKASKQSWESKAGNEAQYAAHYENERYMTMQDLEGRYGGTFDELVRGATGGSSQEQGGLVQMINDIMGMNADEEQFGGLREELKFGGQDLVNAFNQVMTGDMLRAFQGQQKFEGNDPYAQLWNSLVDRGIADKEGAFEADKSLVSDTSAKVKQGAATENEIATMQKVLEKYDYDLGKSGADGIAGEKTRAAMDQFAADIESGKVSLETLPEATAEASAAASEFAAWLRGLIDDSNPTKEEKPIETPVSAEVTPIATPPLETPTIEAPPVSGGSGGVQIDSATVSIGSATTDSAGLSTPDISQTTPDISDGSSGAVAALSDASMTAASDVSTLGSSVAAVGDSSSSAASDVSALGSTSSAASGGLSSAGSAGTLASGGLSSAGSAGSAAAGGLSSAGGAASGLGGAFGAAASAASGFASKVNGLEIHVPAVSFGGGGSATPAMPTPHATGGIFGRAHYGLVAEDGPEAIIPLSEKRRDRGMALWEEAGRRLGVRRYAEGGIVGGSSPAAAVPSSGTSGGIAVQVAPGAVVIQVEASGGAAGIVDALRSKLPEVANQVAEYIARGLEQNYGNMATVTE